jgi:hypothetical protein
MHNKNTKGSSWQDFIDMLDTWSSVRDQMEDDETIAPSETAIAITRNLCEVYRHMRNPPIRISPNRDGGIVIVWKMKDYTITKEILENGSIENYVTERPQNSPES